MEQVVKAVEDELHRTEGARLSIVRLKVSVLSHLLTHDQATLQTTFRLAARGTKAEGARVEIIPVPSEAWCPECKSGTAVTGLDDACSVCGGPVVAGLEKPEIVLHELVVQQ
ncbi:MAG: hypothetical protein A4E19_05145 [Nitrospira sp. SG-bin1]|nr:MAG: hypothetical protein A4E19_05145 [Nitrospira sp. SG-bin1]